MLDPNTDSPAAQPPLPLFRPEVLASQQQKFFGNALMIRPFSTGFFIWLGIALAGFVLGILLLRHYLNVDKTASGHQSALSQDIKTK